MKNIRKPLAFILALIMMMTAMPLTALADEIDYDDSGVNTDGTVSWTYTADTDTLYINGDTIQILEIGYLPTYKGDQLITDLVFSHLVFGKDVRIIQDPEYADYCIAVEVSEYAYSDFRFDISFEEGSTLDEIGNDTFYSSTVTSVTLPDDEDLAISIGSYAFANSPYLRHFTMYDNVCSISNNLFTDDNKLFDVRLSSSLTTIPSETFMYCTQLKSIEIPDGIVNIESSAFQSSAIESITLPDSVTTIEERAFAVCAHLANVDLSPSVKKLQGYTFTNCTIMLSSAVS